MNKKQNEKKGAKYLKRKILIDNIIEEMKDNITLRKQLVCFKYKQERDNVKKTFSELKKAKDILKSLSDTAKRLENRKIWVEAINLLLYKEILAENPWIMEEE